jgi:Tol biopolymer transport system component
MIRVMLVAIVSVLVIIPMFGGCTPSTQAPTLITVDNQTLNPQGSDVADNKTIFKPVALPPNPEYQEKIVFWSLRDGMWMWNPSMKWNTLQDQNYEIYIMDPDGKNQVRLTDDPARDFGPRISPDGTKILFFSNRKWGDKLLENNYDIYVMNIDGTDVRNITDHLAYDIMPSWSPDGSMIVFCSNHNSWTEIWVTNAVGNRFVKLATWKSLPLPSWPKWSQDGKKILCNSLKDGNYSLQEVEIDYDMVKQIIFNPTPENYSGELWSATGDRVVLKPPISERSIMQASSFLNPLVKSIKALTDRYSGWDGGAAYSPNGSKIAYVSSRRDVNQYIYDLYIINADGNKPINVTNSIGFNGQGAFNDWPAWSPDNNQIFFVSDREGKPLDFGIQFKNAWQIYKMDADGSNVTRIISNNYADGSPDWGRVPVELAVKLQAKPTPEIKFKSEAVISALDLDKIRTYIGKEVAIEGTVVDYGSLWDPETRPIVLYFDNPQQHCQSSDEWKQGQCGTDFRTMINYQDLRIFPDIYTYLNKKVRVLGKLEYYKGAPCIIARDPQQITIIK